MSVLAWEVRNAFRRLVRAPSFLIVTILTLVMGIGANAVMFGIVDRILLQPPWPVRDVESVGLLFVHRTFQGVPFAQKAWTHIDYERFSEASNFAELATVGSRSTTLGQGPDAVQLKARVCSETLFPLLNVVPYRGRFFAAADNRSRAEPVVVLGYRAWKRVFGGDEGIIGRTVDIGEVPRTVIGIAPRGFTDIELKAVDVWIPILSALASSPDNWRRDHWWLTIVARLKSAESRQAAASEATAILKRTDAEIGSGWDEGVVTIESLIAAQGPNPTVASRVAAWLTGVSLVVLLIACANVSNLLLARGIRLRQENALRMALGMSRVRFLVQMLSEIFLIALPGGLIALAVAFWAGPWIQGLLIPEIEWSQGILGYRLLFVSLALTLIVGLSSALAPLIASRESGLSVGLKEADRTHSRSHSWLRSGLVLTQTVLSVVLLVGAGLFVKSLIRVDELDLGFVTDRVIALQPTFASSVGEEERQRILEDAREFLERQPGVASATAVSAAPFLGSQAISFRVRGMSRLPTVTTGGPYIIGVSGRYFTTLGIEIRRGRALGPQDGPGSPPVAVVGETMARLLWPQEEALGQCLLVGSGAEVCTTVVGVARDARRQALVEGETMQYYVPAHQASTDLRLLLVKADSDRTTPLHLRREIHALLPELRYVDARPYAELLSPRKRAWRLGASAFLAFGILALLVASVGLYSTLSFDVAQRRTEMGIRAALGASGGRLVRLILSKAFRQSTLGVVLGLLTAAGLAPILQDLLFETSPHDPVVYVAVGFVLFLTSLLASLVPSWTAARSDPNRILRLAAR